MIYGWDFPWDITNFWTHRHSSLSHGSSHRVNVMQPISSNGKGLVSTLKNGRFLCKHRVKSSRCFLGLFKTSPACFQQCWGWNRESSEWDLWSKGMQRSPKWVWKHGGHHNIQCLRDHASGLDMEETMEKWEGSLLQIFTTQWYIKSKEHPWKLMKHVWFHGIFTRTWSIILGMFVYIMTIDVCSKCWINGSDIYSLLLSSA